MKMPPGNLIKIDVCITTGLSRCRIAFMAKIALERDSFNFHTDYVPLKAKSFAELQDILVKGVENNINFVNGTDEDFWLQTYTLKAGDHVIATLPRIGALRFIINNHLIHHRGQLSLYLRMLDIPVPGLYGPSADEA